MTFRIPQSRHPERRENRWESISGTVGGLTFAAGLMGALYEALRWWQSGLWLPIDGSSIARWLIPGTWLDAPRSFLLLHKLVSSFLGLPLFLTGPFVFWLIAGSVFALLAATDRRRAAVEQHEDDENDLRKAA